MSKGICSVEGCDSETRAKGFCNRHYLQIYFNGKISSKIVRNRNEVVKNEDFASIYFYDRMGTVKNIGKIDIEDIDTVQSLKWYVASTGYAKNDTIKMGLHNYILGGLFADHINGDRLDNRRCNLRQASLKENNRNARTYSSFGFKGVAKHGKRFVARIYCDGTLYKIGVFDTPIEAAAAYNVYASRLFGEFAWLNAV